MANDRGWLNVRGLTDVDQLRRARMIMLGAGACVVYMLAVAAEGLAARNWPMVVLPLSVGLAAIAGFLVARGGRLAAAEWTTLLLAALATAAVIAVQGVVAVRIGIILITIVFLGLAGRPWMAPAHAVLALGLGAAAVVAPRAGVLIPLSPSTMPVWIGVLRQIFLITLLMAAFTSGFNRLHRALDRHTRQLRAAHDELLAARARLESLVKERAAAIERATADLETFASSVAHDLSAPLRHVQGFLDMFVADAAELGSARLAPVVEARDVSIALIRKVEAILIRERPPRQRPAGGTAGP